MATQVILLEKIESLGNMGDVVNVKPGYARNYLLPQSKALRATKDNIAYFEAQKANLEKLNDEKKKEAEKVAKSLKGVTVSIVRQASEGGQLYGSVTSRDIAEAVTEATKQKIERYMITLNQNFKLIGLFPVDVVLHPEVKVAVTINIARSADEAAIQLKSGKALISDDQGNAPVQDESGETDAREGVLEDDALKAEKEREKAEAEEKAKADAEAAEKAAARAEKKAAKAEAEAEGNENPEEHPVSVDEAFVEDEKSE